MNDELDTLAQSYIDGTLAAGDVPRLNALLLESAGARREFAERLNLDSSIAAAAAGWTAAGAGRDRVVGGTALWRRLALAACAALCAAGALWWQVSHRPFAEVERSVGAASLPVGQMLRGGVRSIGEGTVELVTSRGVRVVIEAPAEFQFESPQRLHMLRGRLAADVPPAAKGFAVVTPSGEVVDLGTRFGVDVPPSGVSEVHVFEGEVIATATGAEAERNLFAGDAVTMEAGVGTARDLRSSAFIHPDELAEFAAGRRPGAEAALAALADDPSLIALFDFEADRRYPGVFRMVQGRWPGSRAPEFVNVGDHLKFDAGGGRTWPELTLAAWVRLDRLDAPYQSLLHMDGWGGEGYGLVHWMINEATTMRFAVWGNTLAPGSAEAEDYPDSRSPVLSDRGRWIHLATVYDSVAKTVRFYLNGRFDKQVRQAVAHPARLGPAQIGNWDGGRRKLSGRVDEIVVLGRTMDDGEVRALFEAGNPYRSHR